MKFRVSDVEFFANPQEKNVAEILEKYNLTFSEIQNFICNHIFHYLNFPHGFQIELHDQLEQLFKKKFDSKGFSSYPKGYSPHIDLRPDLVISKNKGESIFIEFEFRPNEFKDIVKFQIGYKNDLELGILVMAKNRARVNRKYTTMPEFGKCKKILNALMPECPILLIGIDGNLTK